MPAGPESTDLKLLEQKIAEVERQIENGMGPLEKAVTLWTTIAGVDGATAWSLVAETGANYEDLGADYFDQINAEGLKRYLVKRLERMGHRDVRTPAATPA